MRVLICPDKFAGTLTAVEAASAIAEGWRATVPGDHVTVRPLADGGPGFLDVLAAGLGATARRLPVPTVDPLGRPVRGELLLAGDVCHLESAQACGLHLLADTERDPKITTSYGLGVLVATAMETGARRIVVGLGGSGTNDGGAGMLAALGAAPTDAVGYTLPYGGAALVAAAGLTGTPRLRAGVDLLAATDVDSPLTGPTGASAVFGPQKGATAADVALLDAALTRYAEVLRRTLPHCPPGLSGLPGAGAAGGIGAALLALGGHCRSGIDLVSEAVGLDAALDAADLVVTGEGAFDEQSLRGKVVHGVAAAARRRGLPCVVLAGRVRVTAEQASAVGVTSAYSLVEHFGGPVAGGGARAMARAADGLRDLAADVAGRR